MNLVNKFSFHKNKIDEPFIVAHEKGINIYDHKIGLLKWGGALKSKKRNIWWLKVMV